MADKRMFSLSVVDTDWFLDLPLSTQALYFHLNLRADDDGFVDAPNSIVRKIGASKNDFDLLIAKRYVLKFESGIIVIKHWRMHNTIQKDRYHPTQFQEELKLLSIKDNKSYTDRRNKQSGYGTDTNCIQNVSVDLDKDLDIDKGIVLSNSNELSNTSAAISQDISKAVIILPCLSNYNHPIFEEDIKHYKELYPAVDILQELKKMLGWLESNPSNRKTKNGIKSFITRWLSKVQDKAPKVEEDNNSFKGFRKLGEEDNKKSGFGDFDIL